MKEVVQVFKIIVSIVIKVEIGNLIKYGKINTLVVKGLDYYRET